MTSHLSICIAMTNVSVCGKDTSLMSALVKVIGVYNHLVSHDWAIDCHMINLAVVLLFFKSRLEPPVIVWMVPKVGNWCFIMKTLKFVMEVEVYWALALAQLFGGLLWGMLFVVEVDGR
jgi:uncharacterized Tic20 family protein